MDITSILSGFGNLGWTLLFFVIALSVIVAIHEYGHYIVGRWTGIDAEVFSLGFGPVLVSRMDRRGTRWQIAAIPFGGYVKFVGDANAVSAPDEDALGAMDPVTRRRSVHGAPLWARAATVAAGPVFNLILSIVVFAGLIAVQGVTATPMKVAKVYPLPDTVAGEGLQKGDVILAVDRQDVSTEEAGDALNELPDTPTLTYTVRRDGEVIDVVAPHLFPALVGSVLPNSAADDIGMKPGDVIVSVNGAPIGTFKDLQDATANSEGKPLLLGVWRDGVVSNFTLVPRLTDLPTGGGGFETSYKIGLTGRFLIDGETEFPGVWSSIKFGFTQTWEVIVTTISGIKHMVAGQISSCNIQGPIGIAKTSGEAAAAGVASFIAMIAILSTAIGLLNLFPVPVLDGGHLVFHAYEWLAGRPPSHRAMQAMMSVGLVLVLALMAFGLTNDLRC